VAVERSSISGHPMYGPDRHEPATRAPSGCRVPPPHRDGEPLQGRAGGERLWRLDVDGSASCDGSSMWSPFSLSAQ
jgi:hypothetical protein